MREKECEKTKEVTREERETYLCCTLKRKHLEALLPVGNGEGPIGLSAAD